MTSKPEIDELANYGLSDEELAALAEDDPNDTDSSVTAEETNAADTPQAEAKTDSDGGDASPKVEAEAAVEEEAPAEEAPSEEAPAEEAPAEETAAEDEPTDAATRPPTDLNQSFRAQLVAAGIPEDLAGQIETNQQAIGALDKQLEDGEIDYADHAKQNRTLSQEAARLAAQDQQREFVENNNAAAADQQWKWELDRFLDENAGFQSKVMSGALSGALDELYADESNAGRTYRWFLTNAADNVRSELGMNQEAEPTPKSAAEPAPAPEPPPIPPKTLGGVPEADKSAVGADKFSHLDNLSGMDLEAELAKMSDSEARQYLEAR